MGLARISQVPTTALLLPDDAKARISQEPVTVLVLPDSAKARVSQATVTVLYSLQHDTVQVRETPAAGVSAPTPTLNNTSWWPGSRVTIAGR